MTNKKPLIPPMLLMFIGVLLVVLPMLINTFVKIPDFLLGMSMGVGIVLEIAAFVMLKKVSGAASKSKQPNS